MIDLFSIVKLAVSLFSSDERKELKKLRQYSCHQCNSTDLKRMVDTETGKGVYVYFICNNCSEINILQHP